MTELGEKKQRFAVWVASWRRLWQAPSPSEKPHGSLFLSVYLAKGFLISTKSRVGPHYLEAVVLFQNEERGSVQAQKKPELSEWSVRPERHLAVYLAQAKAKWSV